MFSCGAILLGIAVLPTQACARQAMHVAHGHLGVCSPLTQEACSLLLRKRQSTQREGKEANTHHFKKALVMPLEGNYL